MMHRKYLALIIVGLFIVTVLNSSIVAERHIDRIDRITMTRDIIRTNKKFMKINDSVIQNCIETEDYSELLKFMGNGSNIKFNVHVNASGRGLYLAKRIKYVKMVYPLPRFNRMGFLPPALINQWLFYVKFNNESTYDPITKKNITSNAYTYIEPENGDPPIRITGNHSILALVWQIIPIKKVIGMRNRIERVYNRLLDPDPEDRLEIPLPWSFEKWDFKHMWNWSVAWPNDELVLLIPAINELMFMIMTWPFNIWISFLNLRYGSRIGGMSTFVIWNNSTADP